MRALGLWTHLYVLYVVPQHRERLTFQPLDEGGDV